MGYWDATEIYLQKNYNPQCSCGKEMFAADDHGRFLCSCGETLDTVTNRLSRSSREPIFGPRRRQPRR